MDVPGFKSLVPFLNKHEPWEIIANVCFGYQCFLESKLQE